MSCSIPRLISYYSDKVNIYNSDCFVKLPPYRTCPAPSMICLIAPQVCQGPCGPIIVPIPPPVFPAGTFCQTGCGPCGTTESGCGPCGTTESGCGPCGTIKSGCGPCGTAQTACGPCGQR